MDLATPGSRVREDGTHISLRMFSGLVGWALEFSAPRVSQSNSVRAAAGSHQKDGFWG